MASTLPHHSSDKPMFIPPQKRRAVSGKTGTFTPSKSTSKPTIYGDQILNVQGRPAGASSENLEVDRDVLGSLEKTGTMSTMRSVRSNGSVPTLERVKREESNHSIGSQSQTSSGQLSERSTDIDLVREAVHQKRSRRLGSRLSTSRQGVGLSRSSSVNTSGEELDNISVVERREEDRVKSIQSRPLPQLPPVHAKVDSPPVTQERDKTLPKLQMIINANDEAIEILNTESVRSVGGHGINMTLRHEHDISTNEKSSLVKQTSRNGFLTMTGTIKNGKNKGECFDVQLRMDRDGLAKIEKEANFKNRSSCLCGLNRGFHVLLPSLILVPFLWIFCTLYALYMGTITWYNIFIYYNEQRSCCHTLFVSPCVLLFYPLWIIPVTIGLGVYGGFSQISWYWANWRKELTDPEKGFFGWLCNKLSLPDCSPYQVVILTSYGDDPDTLTSVI